MALDLELQPIKKAIIKNLQNYPPEKIVFVIGKKGYRAREVIRHVTREDKLAEEIIQLAIRVSCSQTILTPDCEVTEEMVEATVKMFG